MSIAFYDPINVHAGDQTTDHGIREKHLIHYTHQVAESYPLGETGFDISDRLAVVCSKSSNMIECIFGSGWLDSRVSGVDLPEEKPEWNTGCLTVTPKRGCAETLQDIERIVLAS